jgi:hypothetical protein
MQMNLTKETTVLKYKDYCGNDEYLLDNVTSLVRHIRKVHKHEVQLVNVRINHDSVIYCTYTNKQGETNVEIFNVNNEFLLTSNPAIELNKIETVAFFSKNSKVKDISNSFYKYIKELNAILPSTYDN